MENMNNFQGKRPDQYKKSAMFTWYGFLGALLISILLTLCGCSGTYHLTDAEYTDVRETHASITYYNCCESRGFKHKTIYWGWQNGFYYYYGKPHYYPWYFYYNNCPPSNYNKHTHITVNKAVNKPTYKPNKNKVIIHGSKRPNKKRVTKKSKK